METTKTTIHLRFKETTKGAIRFQEINNEGADLKGDDGTITSLYFRKATFGNISALYASTGEIPQVLHVEVMSE